MGFTSFHIGHASILHKTGHFKKRIEKRAEPNPSCYTGGFYISPTNGATIDSLTPLELKWDNTCLDTEKADIYVLAPGSAALAPHVWNNIPFADGKYTLKLLPRWWNSTSSQSLQVSIVPAGSPLGATVLPAGPVFTATYTPPADGTVPVEADVNRKDDPATSAVGATSKSLSSGKTAAAVLLPLLFIIGLIIAYFKFQRNKAAKSRKDFAEKVDKRMSVVSTDWKSMSAAGATAAIRNSIAVNRESSAFTFGAIRPVSSISTMEGGQAGVGSAAGSYNVGQMAQVRTGTGVGLRNPNGAIAFAAERASRVSRVSFATDTRVSRVSFADSRPSGESRRTRAFHSAYIPPLPTQRMDVISTVTAASVYPDSEIESDTKSREADDKVEASGSPTLSPRQTYGPLTLTPEDIRARMDGKDGSLSGREEAELDEVMPALSMMRTGIEAPIDTTAQYANYQPQSKEDYLFTPLPAVPTPTHPKALSPTSPASLSPFAPSFTGATYASTTANSTSPPSAFSPSVYIQQQSPMMPAPALVMSPDDMLKAYAERKAAASPVPSSPKKGRKLSLRASFGGRKEKSRLSIDKVSISHPMPAPGTGNGGTFGMAGVGAGVAYTIGEDDEEVGSVDYANAYGGTAN